MANCKEWLDTDLRDRIQITGKIIHLLTNDSDSFVAICSMIRGAEQSGKLDNVEILPAHREEDKY